MQKKNFIWLPQNTKSEDKLIIHDILPYCQNNMAISVIYSSLFSDPISS